MIITRVVILVVACFAIHVISLQYASRKRSVQNLALHRFQQKRRKQYTQARDAANMVNEPTSADYYKLHELFYNGIPDKYDLQGNKIKGVAPDPKKAIYYLELICEKGNPDMWFKLASIYQNGMYNFDPNLQQARSFYQDIMNRFPQHLEQAQDALTDVITEINNIQTYGWLNLDYKPKKNTHHDKIKAMLARVGARGQGGGINSLIGGVAIKAADLFRATPAATVNAGNAVNVDVNAVGHNDNHNTHNSQVVGTVAHSLNKLKKGTTITSCLSDSLKQIRNFLGGKPSCDRRQDAHKSLDSIERNIIPITSINMKESEALNILWNRINDETHTDNQSDIKDIFYGQLADMQEHGKSVCATGRLSRMVDTLNTFDADVVIKPTYAIDQEMMEKAGKLREDLYKDLPQDQADKLRAGTAQGQDAFDTKARETIVSTLTKDYVDTGIMTENAFTKTVEGWIDEI
jgi:hypothetical protein